MDDMIIAFLITFIIGCPEITVFGRSGMVRFHCEGFICKIIRTIILQSQISEASILIDQNNQTLKKLKEIEAKNNEK